ncbi:GNAT family N-acetyltransferase [Oceanospirillum sediminis]|uniref:GNAT family N-acetyltransferase n=1 Tax=Oceanospirillum sediminis TaxID=2760088 RepID=A0A839INS9_9GAMM|nr:GNAT family N-acetyltransferase [Oceanospirillum sediminis]MBB1486598.1 GNAT family N-acetyltransferase [Oceanospirillum sediminis]
MTHINISEHITLEPLAVSDAEAIFLLIDSSRESLSQYLYWVDSVTDIATTRKYIQSRVCSGLDGAAWYRIKFLSENVGVFGIKSVDVEKQRAEIGYWLHSDYQGNGIITQSVSGIAQHLKRNRAVRYLEIRCLEKNKASIAVAVRAGGQHSGTISGYNTIGGALQDLYIYTVPL